MTQLQGEQIERVGRIMGALAEVRRLSLHDWMAEITVGMFVEQQLCRWECVARAYVAFVQGRVLTLSQKREALQSALHSFNGRRDESVVPQTSELLTQEQRQEIEGYITVALGGVFSVTQARVDSKTPEGRQCNLNDFHRLWTLAGSGANYNKSDWKSIESQLMEVDAIRW